jgi:hypothetical protein
MKLQYSDLGALRSRGNKLSFNDFNFGSSWNQFGQVTMPICF